MRPLELLMMIYLPDLQSDLLLKGKILINVPGPTTLLSPPQLGPIPPLTPGQTKYPVNFMLFSRLK